MSILQSIASR